MSKEITKKEIGWKIIFDLGALISVGCLVVFTTLAVLWLRDNYFWGTAVFILVAIVFSMQRFKQPGAKPESKQRFPISFQSMGYHTTVEDKSALDGFSTLVFRMFFSALFIIFIPIDLVIQTIRFFKSDT